MPDVRRGVQVSGGIRDTRFYGRSVRDVELHMMQYALTTGQTLDGVGKADLVNNACVSPIFGNLSNR